MQYICKNIHSPSRLKTLPCQWTGIACSLKMDAQSYFLLYVFFAVQVGEPWGYDRTLPKHLTSCLENGQFLHGSITGKKSAHPLVGEKSSKVIRESKSSLHCVLWSIISLKYRCTGKKKLHSASRAHPLSLDRLTMSRQTHLAQNVPATLWYSHHDSRKYPFLSWHQIGVTWTIEFVWFANGSTLIGTLKTLPFWSTWTHKHQPQ